MAIQECPSRFGSVCPLLKLSQHFDVDYDTVLMAADWVVHQRYPNGLSNDEIERRNAAISNRPDYQVIEIETRVITDWMKEQHREAEQLQAAGLLAFEGGRWIARKPANANH